MKETNWTKVTEVLLLWQGIITVAGGVMTAGVALILKDKLPPQIPLFYSRPWGEDQLATPGMLVWPVGLTILIILISAGVVTLKVDKLLKTFVVGISLLGQIIVVLGIIRIFFLIT